MSNHCHCHRPLAWRGILLLIVMRIESYLPGITLWVAMSLYMFRYISIVISLELLITPGLYLSALSWSWLSK